jgi:hypothetical protein
MYKLFQNTKGFTKICTCMINLRVESSGSGSTTLTRFFAATAPQLWELLNCKKKIGFIVKNIGGVYTP